MMETEPAVEQSTQTAPRSTILDPPCQRDLTVGGGGINPNKIESCHAHGFKNDVTRPIVTIQNRDSPRLRPGLAPRAAGMISARV